jgi:iron complex outermembrane receptor protein
MFWRLARLATVTRLLVLATVIAHAATADASTGGDAQDPQTFKKLSLEQLMEVDVTLVTRRPEPVSTAAAAISVITAEDIRRSGVTTIADAIALADGMHVARFNNGTWAISARGFNQNTANKLLVMVDGRTVYSPLFSGVFWNTADYVLEDLERIEVIRGPGATLWGANAVNGVINIVTRSARDTHGTFVSVGTGNEDPGLVEARYGGGTAVHWRTYAKFVARDAQKRADDESSGDDLTRGQVGFRMDGGAPDGGASWVFRGDVLHSRVGLPDRPDGEFTDANLQGRWAHVGSAGRLQVQSYYRHEYRRVPLQLTHRLDSFDIDVQNDVRLGRRHALIMGAGARVNHDRTHGSAVIHFEPDRRTYPLFSAFAQDEFALRPTIALTAGLKIEHNTFSGADWQPNVRARWTLPRRQTLWTAVARATRRPTRFDDDIVVSAANGLALVRGSDDFESEKLTSWELGYRAQPSHVVSFDATGFAHSFDDLRSQEAPLAGVIPLVVGNTLEGRSAGIELGVNVQPIPAWRTHVGYTYLDTTIDRAPGSRDVSGGVNEANDPHHVFSIRTTVDLPRNIEADVWLRGVGALPNPVVPGFVELNARLGWRATRTVDLALIGQDLLHDRHPEFGAPNATREEFERGIRLQLTLRLP